MAQRAFPVSLCPEQEADCVESLRTGAVASSALRVVDLVGHEAEWAASMGLVVNFD